MKTDHQQRIEEFMRKVEGLAPGKQGIPELPTYPTEAVRLLRARLILEEALETVLALGFHVLTNDCGEHVFDLDLLEFLPVVDHSEPTDEERLAMIADGCADLSVVTIGTLSACGLPDTPILEEVDRNNLAKFGPGHSVNVHGKLVKPPDHRPPDLLGVILSIAEGGA